VPDGIRAAEPLFRLGEYIAARQSSKANPVSIGHSIGHEISVLSPCARTATRTSTIDERRLITTDVHWDAIACCSRCRSHNQWHVFEFIATVVAAAAHANDQPTSTSTILLLPNGEIRSSPPRPWQVFLQCGVIVGSCSMTATVQIRRSALNKIIRIADGPERRPHPVPALDYTDTPHSEPHPVLDESDEPGSANTRQQSYWPNSISTRSDPGHPAESWDRDGHHVGGLATCRLRSELAPRKSAGSAAHSGYAKVEPLIETS